MPARISLAGRIVVAVDGRRVDERALPGAQSRLVLLLLACQRHEPVTREELADNLWPEQRPDTWQAALRGVVGRVRGFLVSAGLGDRGVVRASAGTYRLYLPGDVWVDLERAGTDTERSERALGEGRAQVAGHLAARARSVLARPLLPGVEAPWLDGKRRELSGQLLRCLEALAEARLALGEHRHAAAAAEQAVALDAFRESAHRLLIRAHVAAGNQAAGLWAYERCRQLLATELGTDPAPETQALHARLLQSGALAVHGAHRRPAQVGLPEQVPGPGPDLPEECPYRGLRTFQEADAGFFFGRSADVSRLLDRLQGAALLAVLGPSGSGKSSLVRAGLVPALRRGALPGSDTWAVAVLRPGRQPLAALARQVAGLAPGLDEATVERRVRARPEALHEAVEEAAAARRVVLVVDQLEEAFTLCAAVEQRRAFLEALAAAASARPGRLAIVLTLRADFYPRIAEHPRLADLVSSQQFLVVPMDEVGLAEAVAGPARAVGLRPGAGLVETILADVLGQPGSLPLLSHCLVEVWERRSEGALTLEAYHDAGGVEGALAQRAEAVYARLPAAEQALARRVLLRLVQPGAGEADTRRRVAFAELLTSEAERERVEAVVNRLTEARLLTAGGPPDGQRWLEVCHDALIGGWPRLHGWVEEDRAGLRVHRRLTAAAQEWERLGHDSGALYRGAGLAEAVAWTERRPGDANQRERAFLDASVALEASQRRQRVTRLRLLAASLAAGLLVVAALAVVALLERGRAEEQERLARSRALAAEASGQLALEPAAGLALAVEALEVARTREAVAALRQALVTAQPQLGFPGGRRDFTVDPGGRHLVVGADDGAARVWDLGSGAPVATLDGHAGPVHVTTFSPDGSLLATTDDHGARIWDAGGWTLRHTLPHDEAVRSAAWPDAGGDRLLTAAAAGGARLWDAVTGETVTTIETSGAVSHLHMAAGGDTVLAWSAVDPELFVVDLAAGRQRSVLEGHEAAAVDARVSPDGLHALSVGLDATARLWDLATGEEVAVLGGFADPLWVGGFSPDGERVIVGDATGTVRVAGVPGGQVVFERDAHGGAVVGAAFGPDGSVAATASADGTALVWDVEAGQPREVLTLDAAARLGVESRSVQFTPDGRRLLTRAATVQVWDVPEGPAMTLRGHGRTVSALGLSPDGALLATGDHDGVLRLWNLATGAEVHALEVPGSAVAAVAFSADGAAVTTANPAPSTVAETTTPPTVWDVASGQQVRSLAVPAPTRLPCPQVCQTGSVAYGPDGSVVLTAGQDGVVRLWDAATGALRRSLDPAGEWVRAATFSPDGRWVAGAAWRRVPIWDAASGAVARELPAPGIAVAFSPGGDVLAVGGDDGIASLWAPATGRLLGELRHSASVTGVAWSADGRFLATAAGDSAVLWDVASQQRIQRFADGSGTHAVAFTPGDAIVTGTADGTVHVHRCTVCGSVDELVDQARERRGRQITPAEVGRYAHEPAG